MKNIIKVIKILVLTPLLCIGFTFNTNGQTSSDTIDIYQTNVFIDIPDISINNVTAWTELEVVNLINNTTSINFDLTDSLTVDSVLVDNQMTTFTHSNHQLKVIFSAPVIVNDSLNIKVFYHGAFEKDPNGFGGNYFTTNYAYNVGVSLTTTPHSYGRAWHPCFDNFVEKSPYTITIKCDTAFTSFCTGNKILDSTSLNSRYTTWQLDQPVSSYLTGFAVSDYETLQWDYISPIYSDTTPVIIGARAIDTQNVKLSFQNLNNAVEIYENKYGEYQWDRIGYVMTPFPYGAMEHATNVVYPLVTIAGGSLAYETLYAHELAHHWWGDYITCEDSKEMWINEGMARFSEFIFLENLYGQIAYKEEVYDNHYDVLLKHYIIDEGYYPIADVPQEFTYGETTYNKGADIIYNLRGYLGDSLFFIGLKGVLDSAKWGTLSSLDFQNYMGNTIGVDLSDFFNGWVFQPGFPDFDIDSYTVSGTAGNYILDINIIQKLRGLTVYHQNVPLVLTVMDNNNVEHHFDISVSGALTAVSLNLNFMPVNYYLNKDRIINYATTVVESTINQTPTSFSQSNLYNAKTYSSNYTLDLRIENHWVEATGTSPSHIILSKDRYWKVDGNMTTSEPFEFRLYFNGQPNSYNYDINLVNFVGNSFNEDSLVIMYRPTPNDNWEIYPYVSYNPLGAETDAWALFSIDSVSVPGQFTFGYKLYNAGLDKVNHKKSNLIVYPNPVDDKLKIANLPTKNTMFYTYKIIDEQGKLIAKGVFNILEQNDIDVSQLPKGVYIIKLTNDETEFNQKFVKG